MKQVTLTVITKENQILLGMKKRGFGEGKWNGFGGKPETDENLLDCVCRETHEEAGIVLNPALLEKVAILDFSFENKPDWAQQVHVYKTDTFEGVPIETGEMRPQFYDLDKIPYEQMWTDDIYWLPLVLDKKKVTGSFHFGDDGEVLRKELTVVESLN